MLEGLGIPSCRIIKRGKKKGTLKYGGTTRWCSVMKQARVKVRPSRGKDARDWLCELVDSKPNPRSTLLSILRAAPGDGIYAKVGMARAREAGLSLAQIYACLDELEVEHLRGRPWRWKLPAKHRDAMNGEHSPGPNQTPVKSKNTGGRPPKADSDEFLKDNYERYISGIKLARAREQMRPRWRNRTPKEDSHLLTNAKLHAKKYGLPDPVETRRAKVAELQKGL